MRKTTYNRIGAYELKASYQRNMLMSTLLVATIALLATFYFSSDKSDATPVEPIGTVDTFVVTIPPSTSIIIDRGDKPRKSSYKDISVGIPFPVPDDELPDDWEDITIATKNDLIDLVNSQFDTPDIGDGDIIIYEPPDDMMYPPMDSVFFVEIQPRMVYEEKPIYPRLAQKAGMEAIVWIKALVDIDGIVVDAVVYKSSGSNIGFDRAAVDAALLCRYSPGIQNGIPVPVWVCYKVEFRLKD